MSKEPKHDEHDETRKVAPKPAPAPVAATPEQLQAAANMPHSINEPPGSDLTPPARQAGAPQVEDHHDKHDHDHDDDDDHKKKGKR